MLVEREVKEQYIDNVMVRPGVLITTPGIYHNAKLGLISLSSDGTTWITIAEKNLGATSTDITKDTSYGCYYQWGNNYSFPTTGTITTSATAVNASNYGPNNYYSSNTFITNQPRDSSNNADLWGGTTNTNIARRGPCPYGWHIPSYTECSNLINALYNLVGGKKQAEFEQYLFMTNPKVRQASSGNVITSTYAYIQASTKYSDSNRYCIRFNASTEATVSTSNKSQGNVIRPFKNEPVQPREGDDWNALCVIDLKSFEEITAMSYENAMYELNTKPQPYYNKFNSEGHLVTKSGLQVIDYTWSQMYEICWSNGGWTDF